MTEKRICKQCLLRDMEQSERALIERYKGALKKSDCVSDEEYENRLDVCRQCDKLTFGTCQACGCYVELRAAAKISRCPHKKW